MTKNQTTQGFIYAITCYIIWGSFPLYWYPISESNMPAEQILAQRIVWSAIFAIIMVVISKQTTFLLQALRNPKLLLLFFFSALLLSVNWLTYLWAITNDHIIDSSLGYFICPLINMLLGRLFFKERIKSVQALAIFIAILGVLWLVFLTGKIPVVALVLALSFGFYGMLRKQTPASSLVALAFETFWMLPFALLYLYWMNATGQLYFGQLSTIAKWVLIGSGVVTTVPLLLFSLGAKRISLTNLGMIQYISPTIQFFIGLVIFKESFNINQFFGYLLVWIAILIYIVGSLQKDKSVAIIDQGKSLSNDNGD